MKKIIFCVILLLSYSYGHTQSNSYPPPPASEKEKTHDDNEIFSNVDTEPVFSGGMGAFYQFIAANLIYPKSAVKDSIQGKVYIQVVVEKDGSLSDFKIVRSLRKDCDDEVIRVFKLMPNFTPGKQKGRLVRVRRNYPIAFKL